MKKCAITSALQDFLSKRVRDAQLCLQRLMHVLLFCLFQVGYKVGAYDILDNLTFGELDIESRFSISSMRDRWCRDVTPKTIIRGFLIWDFLPSRQLPNLHAIDFGLVYKKTFAKLCCTRNLQKPTFLSLSARCFRWFSALLCVACKPFITPLLSRLPEDEFSKYIYWFIVKEKRVLWVCEWYLLGWYNVRRQTIEGA